MVATPPAAAPAPPHLAYSSIPGWARGEGSEFDAGSSWATGRSYLVVSVGPRLPDANGSTLGIPAGVAPSEIHAQDVAAARAELIAVLNRSAIGIRVILTGSVGDCLALRAVALNAGLEEDEVSIQPTVNGTIEVFCSHCRAVTPVDAQVGEVIACSSCSRNLVVYHHVSRRMGAYLGYMSDAESPQGLNDGASQR